MRLRIRRRVMVRHRLLPRRIRHHPVMRLAIAGSVVIVAGAIVQHAAATARDAKQRWGTERVVAVARHHLDVGEVVDADAVAMQAWPTAVVPADAVDASPVGQTVTDAIEPGEAVLTSRLAPVGLHGLAALLPAGSKAIAVPVGPDVVALAVGDRVDLIAGFDVAGASADQAPAFTVTRDALVLAVDEQRVTVAVRDDDVARVAFAVVAGTIVLALRAT